MSSSAKDIAGWIRQRLTESGARGIVVGLSGGVDSAVVARLAQIAAGADAVGVILPCHSDPRDAEDARLVADHFGLQTVTVPLEPAYDALVGELRRAARALDAGSDAHGAGARLPLVNLKPRLRMTSLYFIANTLDYLVAGTGNRCELAIGYFTKYGDGGVDLLPIGHLLKSEVRALARELDVPAPVIEKAPSAGLWLGQTDEEEMGFSYDDLESYLTRGPQAVPPALALRIERLMRASEHKRALAPVPDFASTM